jgi:hypothetical protein
MFSAVNFQPCVNVLHCILPVTYTFKDMLLLKEVCIIHYSILPCFVWIYNLIWRGTETQSSFTFFCYYFYYSVSNIDSSLHVNQDEEVDWGLQLCYKCSRMKDRERIQYFILPGYVTGFPCVLTSVLVQSVVENLPRNYFLHIVQWTDRPMEFRRTLVWTFITNWCDRIWAHTPLWRNCQYCAKSFFCQNGWNNEGNIKC